MIHATKINVKRVRVLCVLCLCVCVWKENLSSHIKVHVIVANQELVDEDNKKKIKKEDRRKCVWRCQLKEWITVCMRDAFKTWIHVNEVKRHTHIFIQNVDLICALFFPSLLLRHRYSFWIIFQKRLLRQIRCPHCHSGFSCTLFRITLSISLYLLLMKQLN